MQQTRSTEDPSPGACAVRSTLLRTDGIVPFVGRGVVVLGAAVAALAAPTLGTARHLTTAPAKLFRVKLNDGFDVAGTRVACLVQHRGIPYRFNSLICFEQTRPLSYRPRRGTYVAVMDETDVGAELFTRSGGLRAVFSHAQPRPRAKPAVAANSVPLIGGVARLRRGDGAYVSGTNIVCENLGTPSRLTCAQVAGHGVVDHSYSVFIDDAGVRIAQIRGRRMVFVFRGSN